MIYLYGLVEAPTSHVADAIAGLPGLQGAPQAIAAGPWTLVQSKQDTADILPKRRLMLAHTRVLEHMLPLGPVLPARFGMVAESCLQAVAMIGRHATSITTAFNQIRGAAEISVRVEMPRQAALEATLAANPALRQRRDALANSGPGAHFDIAAFGETLADHLDRRRGAAQATLLKALTPIAKDHVLQAPDADTVVLRAAFLVDTTRMAAFEKTLAATTAALPFAPAADPTIQIIGPAPAYNFVRLHLSHDPAETAA